jgi:hypothetical protein
MLSSWLGGISKNFKPLVLLGAAAMSELLVTLVMEERKKNTLSFVGYFLCYPLALLSSRRWCYGRLGVPLYQRMKRTHG